MINTSIRNKKIMVLMVLFSILFTFANAPKVSAKTEAYGAFSIDPKLPKNQIDDKVGYFDLLLDPDMEQTISFDVINDGDSPMLATIEFNNATTGLNAEKSYIEGVVPDKSMQVPITDIATLEKTSINVAPKSRESININLKAPHDKFEGVSLGGIRVTADYEAEEKTKVQDGFVIENRISYVVALQVRMSDEEINKNLNYVKSSAELVDLKPQFVSYIQNDQAKVMNNVTVEGTVNDSEGTAVANISKDTGGIFPNTEFIIAYSLINDKIESGEYTIKLKITSDEDMWEWEENITLEDDLARDLNDNALKGTEDNKLFMIIIMLVLIIVMLLLALIILFKKKNKDQETGA